MNFQEIFLGRQPILDTNGSLVAYELLFRSAKNMNAATIDNINTVVADTLINTFCDFGEQDVLGSQKAFINFDADMLLADTIELLPKDKIVIEALESVRINDEIVQRCQSLREKGFTIALDDFVYDESFKPMLDIAKIVKVDIMETPAEELPGLVKRFEGMPLTLLAEKVEQPEQIEMCKEMGFSLFQGYYFAKPVVLNRKRIDISKLTLLKLLEQVMGGAENKEIEATLKQSPELTYNMLRLVNSVGMGMQHKISSMSHAITILGRSQLKRWVQLLLFVHSDKAPGQNPLLNMAIVRGRLMENLCVGAGLENSEKAGSDLAFMTGVLSLLDVLLSLPMTEIVKQVNLDSPVQDALLKSKGDLGKLLQMVINIEGYDFFAAEEIAREFNFSESGLYEAQINAIDWSNKIVGSI